MKLCDLTQAYTPKSGGIRTYLDAKRSYLRDKTGYEHVLIVPGKEDAVEREGRLTRYTVAAPPVPGCEPYRFILRLDKVLGILRREQPDLIELGSAYVLPAAAFRYRRERPCALVGFYHTDFPTAYVRPVAGRILGKAAEDRACETAERYASWIYGRFDLTVTSSRQLRTKLRAMGLPRLYYTPLGVDLEGFHPGRRDESLRESLGVHPGDILLSYAGRFDDEKRVRVLVEAVDLLGRNRKISLMLMGEGPLRPYLEERAGRNQRIRVLPYQSDKGELARHLASSDIYVTAGPFETFALSVVEAQACGLPVVGVRAGALPERVPPEVGMLGEVDSASEMAANIQALASADLSAWKGRAREHVEMQFSWDATFESLLTVYHCLPFGSGADLSMVDVRPAAAMSARMTEVRSAGAMAGALVGGMSEMRPAAAMVGRVE